MWATTSFSAFAFFAGARRCSLWALKGGVGKAWGAAQFHQRDVGDKGKSWHKAPAAVLTEVVTLGGRGSGRLGDRSRIVIVSDPKDQL